MDVQKGKVMKIKKILATSILVFIFFSSANAAHQYYDAKVIWAGVQTNGEYSMQLANYSHYTTPVELCKWVRLDKRLVSGRVVDTRTDLRDKMLDIAVEALVRGRNIRAGVDVHARRGGRDCYASQVYIITR